MSMPASFASFFQRNSMPKPPSMQASDEPTVDVPMGSSSGFACHKSPIMATQRFSRSAVMGYSSLSMAFFSIVSAMIFVAMGSMYVWQNVVRFCVALPSMDRYSLIISYVMRGSTGWAFILRRGMATSDASEPKMGVEYLVPSSMLSRILLVDVCSFMKTSCFEV